MMYIKETKKNKELIIIASYRQHIEGFYDGITASFCLTEVEIEQQRKIK